MKVKVFSYSLYAANTDIETEMNKFLTNNVRVLDIKQTGTAEDIFITIWYEHNPLGNNFVHNDLAIQRSRRKFDEQ